jgi:tungstate transport system ATP-binding protein
VAFGRALTFNPDVLLLDEPTANLDPRNVRLVEHLIRERQSQGVTIVLATHQIFQARRLAHCAALLLDGQIVEAAPTAELLDHPSDPRTRAFLTGDMIY